MIGNHILVSLLAGMLCATYAAVARSDVADDYYGKSTPPTAPRLVLLGCDPSPDGFVINLAQTNFSPDVIDAVRGEVDASQLSSGPVPCLPVLARLLGSTSRLRLAVARLRSGGNGVDGSQMLVWEGRRRGRLRVLVGCSLDEHSGQLVVEVASTVGDNDVSHLVGSPCLDVLTALPARDLNVVGPIAVDHGLTWLLTDEGHATLVQCEPDGAGDLAATRVEGGTAVDSVASASPSAEPCLATLSREQRVGGTVLDLSAPVPSPDEECLIFDFDSGGTGGGGGGSAFCCDCAPACACGVAPDCATP